MRVWDCLETGINSVQFGNGLQFIKKKKETFCTRSEEKDKVPARILF